MEIHALFDGLAWLSAALVTVGLRQLVGDRFASPGRPATAYLIAVVIGAALGAYGLGTFNLWLSGQAGVARSIEGALAGAIVAVELYKWRKGISGRTAALFALPVAVGIGVGRIGCYLSGIEDFTYGVPTDLPWGHDFGDGIERRHAGVRGCLLRRALAPAGLGHRERLCAPGAGIWRAAFRP